MRGDPDTSIGGNGNDHGKVTMVTTRPPPPPPDLSDGESDEDIRAVGSPAEPGALGAPRPMPGLPVNGELAEAVDRSGRAGLPLDSLRAMAWSRPT